MGNPIMACGHAANALTSDGHPICVICSGMTPTASIVAENQPDLSARMALCECGASMPSDSDLAFFEYRGDKRVTGTCSRCTHSANKHDADGECVCGCKEFVQAFIPAATTDRYYCGHAGWS